jgi:WD40 repeat protein
LLDQGHLNIVNTIEFVKTEKENLCLTAGYDSKLIHWDVQSGKSVREVDLQELFKKHEIKFSTPPFIYCLHFHKNTVYVTTESGHVVAFPTK